MTTEGSRDRLARYNRAIVRGRHPSSFNRCNHVWSFVCVSEARAYYVLALDAWWMGVGALPQRCVGVGGNMWCVVLC